MVQPAAPVLSRRDWTIILLITLLGLALRVAMSHGALWLDEAWSGTHAHEAGTPLGVFLGINHDNNHHLNSLWMQAVGLDAPPLLQRAFAILTGTGTILAAAILCIRQGRTAAIVAALLFAVSPFFVTYGSEARGYAPMMLVLLIVMIRVDRWLAGETPRPAAALALWSALGMLAQLTMVIGLAAVGGWVFITLFRRSGFRAALVESLRTFGPGLIAVALVIGGIIAAAEINSGGMRFGSLEPYRHLAFLKAIFSLAAYTIGVPGTPLWPLIAILGTFVVALGLALPRMPFYWLALLGFPAVVALLHPANPGHSRYYLVIGVAILLLIAEVANAVNAHGGWRRAAAWAGVAAVTGLSLVEDIRLIHNQRGDPGQAIAAMVARSPDGGQALVERESAIPVLAAAAATGHYRLAITDKPCPAPRYLFIDRYNGEELPGPQQRCGRDYTPIASARARGMTNFHWRLYERR